MFEKYSLYIFKSDKKNTDYFPVYVKFKTLLRTPHTKSFGVF